MAGFDEHLDAIEWGRQQDDGEVLLSPAWEVFILGVSILSVFNLVLVGVFRSRDFDQVFIIMDVLLTFVFLLDFSRRLVIARDPKVYLTKGYGWVDAVAAFPVVRILRVLRIVRMLRVMRRLGGPLKAFRAFFSNRAAGGLLSILLVALLVLEFGSLAILWAEGRSPDANITTASDALWYLLVTMSTVGYGDYFPVTELGRLIGSVIIIVGVGVFGTLTGYLANAFLAPSSAVAAVAIPQDARDDADGESSMAAGEEGAAASPAKR